MFTFTLATSLSSATSTAARRRSIFAMSWVTVHHVVSIGGENNAGLPTDSYSKMRDVATP
jgi:hypothetical protein